MKININDTDRTSDIQLDDFKIEQILTSQVDTCDLKIKPTGWTPAVLDEVDIYDDDDEKIFGGYIIKYTQITQSLTPKFTIKCKDYTETMDKRLVVADFSSKTVNEIIDSIVNDYITDKGMVGLWHFNEATGTDVLDETDNDNDGVMHNFFGHLVGHWLMNDDLATTAVLDSKGSNDGVLTNAGNTEDISVEGKINKALEFDGVDDYVDIPDDASLQFTTQDFSIGVWIKIDALRAGSIISKGYHGSDGWQLFIRENGQVLLRIYQVATTQDIASVVSSISADNWCHIIAVRNGSSGKIFVNGVDKTSGTPSILDPVISTRSVYIGYPGRYTPYFDGKLDDVRIYNTAITEDYIKLLYNAGAGTEDEDIWADGKFDKALEINGLTEYVAISSVLNAETFDANTKKTIGIWFKTNVNGQKMIFSVGSTGNDRLYAWTDNDILKVAIGDNTVASGAGITVGEWYYLIVVIDGLSADIYLNGLKVQTKTFTGFTTDDYLVLGQHGASSSYHYDGIIDELAVWNRALSTKEILEYYENDCEHRVSKFTVGKVNCTKTIDTVRFNYDTPSKALQKLADLTAYDWYVDYKKDIHFFDKEQNTAPFELADTTNKYDYRSLVIEKDATQIKNTIFVRGGEYEGNTFTEEIVADGDQRTFPLSYKYSNVAVKIDGTPITKGIDFIDDEADFDCLYNYEMKIIRFPDATKPAVGEVVSIAGNPKIPVLVRVEEPGSISEYGVREFRITDKTIKSKAEAQDRALAELEGYKNKIIEGVFTTDESGLRAGQKIRVVSANRSIDEYFIINKVSIYLRTTSSSGTEFKYKIDLITTKTFDMISLLQSLLSDKKITVGEDEVLEKIYNLAEDVLIEESIIANPVRVANEEATIGESIRSPFAFTWVAGPYHPVDGNDHNRPPLADRDCVLGS